MTRAGAAILFFFFTLGTAYAAPPSAKRCIATAERGQQLRKDGGLVDAQAAFRECSALECPAMVRRDCGKWVEELDDSIPTVLVKLQDEDKKEISGGHVTIDGRALSRSSEGRATPIDPGTHRFVWQRSPTNIEEEVVIREGEKNRIIVLAAPPKKEADVLPPQPTTRSPLPWIVGGAGVVVGVVGATLWGVGLAERADLVNGCARFRTCESSQINGSRTKLIVGDVFVGVGLLAIGAAVYLFLKADPPVSMTTGRAALAW